MEYKRNIYLFLIFDFLTNLSPLSFIYALFLKQQNISLTQIGFIISVYQISKLISMVLTVILNYIISKLFIFNDRKELINEKKKSIHKPARSIEKNL